LEYRAAPVRLEFFDYAARGQSADLRAKTATEADEASGTRTAQAILGHATKAMTSAYIRHKAGKKSAPDPMSCGTLYFFAEQQLCVL